MNFTEAPTRRGSTCRCWPTGRSSGSLPSERGESVISSHPFATRSLVLLSIGKRGRQTFPVAALRRLVFLFAVLASFAAQAAPPDTSDIQVDARIDGGLVTISSSLHIEASPGEVWAVFTDYDHAADFVSNLEYSRVETRDGNALVVHQKGAVKHWPFTFAFDSLRKVQLTPFERLESHLIQGTMKKLDGTTLLTREGAGTRVTDHRETIPNFWIPPVLGRLFIERETRQNFAELRAEILRRKAAGDR